MKNSVNVLTHQLESFSSSVKEQNVLVWPDGFVDEIIDVDLSFHRTICELSDNRRLLEAWLNLSHQLRAFIGLENQLYDDDTPDATLGTHYPVLEAIKAGDANLAVKRMKAVITRGYKKATKYYRQ